MSATTSGPTPSPLPVRPSSKDRESTPEKDDIGSEYVIDAFFEDRLLMVKSARLKQKVVHIPNPAFQAQSFV